MLYLLTENAEMSAQLMGIGMMTGTKMKTNPCVINKTSSQFTPNAFLMQFPLSVLIVPYGKDMLTIHTSFLNT